MNSYKIKLISFAEGPFRPRKLEFIKQASEIQLFDDILVFDLSKIDTEYRRQHEKFMISNPKGFGYWIWKPQIIKQVLSKSNTDDIIVYMDVGFTINQSGKARFQDYLEITKENQWKMLSFQNIHTEYKWTKADLATRLRVMDSKEIMKTSQLAAGFMILCATPENKFLVNEWIKISIESNYKYSDDSPSTEPNHPSFIRHRHDASISSILRKVRGTAITHYEVQAYNHFEKLKPTLPAWATRSKI